MPDQLSASTFAQWGSAILVIASAMIVGRYAAIGMDSQQWACGLFAIAGSVAVAVMVRVWPVPARVEIED